MEEKKQASVFYLQKKTRELGRQGHLIVSVSFNFPFEGCHPSVKINIAKSLSALWRQDKEFVAQPVWRRWMWALVSFCKAVEEPKQDEVAAGWWSTFRGDSAFFLILPTRLQRAHNRKREERSYLAKVNRNSLYLKDLPAHPYAERSSPSRVQTHF